MADMIIVEFAISPHTGNVWAVKPSGWHWRPLELRMALIIPVKIASMIEATRLTIPHFEGGIEEFVPQNRPQCIGERKYSLPLEEILIPGWYPKCREPFDYIKAQDRSMIYQPFLDSNIVVDTSRKVGIFRNNHNMVFPYKARQVAT